MCGQILKEEYFIYFQYYQLLTEKSIITWDIVLHKTRVNASPAFYNQNSKHISSSFAHQVGLTHDLNLGSRVSVTE